MKRMIIGFILFFILIGAFCVAPHVESRHNMVERTQNSIDFLMLSLYQSKLRIAKQILIDTIGQENYTEIEDNVTAIIEGHVDLPDNWFILLKELAVLIVGISVVLFGTGFIGSSIGVLLCTMVLGLPVCLLSVPISFAICYDTFANFVFGLFGGMSSWFEICERIGLIGEIIVYSLLFPIWVLWMSVLVPFVAIGTFASIMAEIIIYAFSRTPSNIQSSPVTFSSSTPQV